MPQTLSYMPERRCGAALVGRLNQRTDARLPRKVSCSSHIFGPYQNRHRWVGREYQGA